MNMISFDFSEDAVVARLDEIATKVARSEAYRQIDDWLNVALEDSFPCSDPISSMRVGWTTRQNVQSRSSRRN
jgi:hypothetical protein